MTDPIQKVKETVALCCRLLEAEGLTEWLVVPCLPLP